MPRIDRAPAHYPSMTRFTTAAVSLLLAFASSLTLVSRAAAQPETGTIAGHVNLTTGVPLPGAQVTVWNETIAVERRVVSDDNGVYEVSDLPAQGVYVVRAELSGFATVMQRGVALVPNQREQVDLVLRPTLSETMFITGRAATVENERSTVQQVVSEALVHMLPLVGRDFLTLTSLTAGFSGNPNFPSPQGQVYWANNVLVDGVSHFSKWRGAARTFNSGYGLESIDEVQVLGSRFSAEYGEALATVTLATTRSGTNDVHGSALFFLQDDLLNSRPAFTSKRPPTGTQRFGATLGGPVTRDRTHYFGSYEGRRSRLENPVTSPVSPGVTAPSDQDEHLAFFKVDHKNRDTDLLTLRYNGQRFRWHEEPGGLVLPGSGTAWATDSQSMFASHTTLVSSVTLNQLRVQFARYADERRDLNPSVYVWRAGHSIEGGTIGPYGFGATPEDTLEVSDVVSHKRAMHAYKLGGGFKLVRSHNQSLPNGYGAYFFGGDPVNFPQPSVFVQGIAATADQATVDPRSLSFYGFVQDDWRLNDRLSLNVGLRYDIERISNVRHYTAPVDTNNLQPRLGVAWEPLDHQFVIRGGIGLYTQQHLLYYINRVELEGPDGIATVNLSPGSPLMPTFPNVLPPALSPLPPRNIVVSDPSFRNPYSLQATAGVEQRLFGMLIGADWVYLRGHDLMSLVDANAPASFPGGPEARPADQADATRPIPPVSGGFRQVLTLGNEGNSWYKALQVKATQSAGEVQTILSYTWAKSEDQANYLVPQDSRNLDAEKARADNDIRHNLAAGFTWQLPGGPRVLSGWTLSGVGIFRSNRPFTQVWGDDRTGTTQNDARPGGRNGLRTEAYLNLDLSMVRQFRFGARVVEARVEAFNVVTNTNYDQYVGALNSVFLYNQPVTAFPPRRIQLAAIVRF